MKVGFTGTQKTLTKAQVESINTLLKTLAPSEAHHGDCIGADTIFHSLCINQKIPVIIHPPINKNKRGFNKNATILPEKDYIPRNHDIVNAVDTMIAGPAEEIEQLRSGTWATVRYTRKCNKKMYLVIPNGLIKEIMSAPPRNKQIGLFDRC